MEDFLDFLERRAGEALRVVSWYNEGDYGLWYARADLDRDAVEERVTFLSERLLGGGGPVAGSSLDELGPEQAMVQIRTEAAILRFPTGERQGILVSLDIEAARSLHSFVVECTEKLGEGVALGDAD